MKNFIIVFLGGGLGSILRYTINILLLPSFSYWTTFFINIMGSFLIGGISSFVYYHIPISSSLKLLLITGFLGGFTTFSTFQLELLLLIQQGLYKSAFLYGLLSLIIGIIAVGMGFITIQKLFSF